MLIIEQYRRVYSSVKYIPKFKVRTKLTTTPIVIIRYYYRVVTARRRNSKFSFLRGPSSEADVFASPIVRYYYYAYSIKLLTSFFLLLLNFRPALHSVSSFKMQWMQTTRVNLCIELAREIWF